METKNKVTLKNILFDLELKVNISVIIYFENKSCMKKFKRKYNYLLREHKVCNIYFYDSVLKKHSVSIISPKEPYCYGIYDAYYQYTSDDCIIKI